MVPCREAFTTVTSGNPREHGKSLGSQAVRLRPLFEPEPSRDWPEVTPLCGSSHPAADAPAPAPDLAAGSRSPVWRPPLAPHLAALGPSEAGTRARSQLGSDLALLPVPTPESSGTQEESRRLSMSCFYSTVIRILKKHQRPSARRTRSHRHVSRAGSPREGRRAEQPPGRRGERPGRVAPCPRTVLLPPSAQRGRSVAGGAGTPPHASGPRSSRLG